MPTFGDFETIDEPIESREDRRQFTQVWQASRISVKDGRLYAVKCYIPRHGRRGEEAPKEDLEEHRSLEFIEGVKQLKKASAEGQQYLTPIYEFGLTPSGDGAWYATDFYGDATPILPRTLRTYITRGGKVDGLALRHTIHSVVLGCLAMKRSRGCSHGNLKTTNVFRAGKPRSLRKTPLVLGDAIPAGPSQLGQLDAKNKLEVGDLLKATMEAHDLHAIGELILQLVEVRLLVREGDYDYPIIPAPAWNALGKDGERWRQLCNRLLNPSLSLDGLSLESIEKELRPGFASSHAPLLAGTVVVLCLVGGGGYFGWRYYEGSQADQRKKLYSNDMDGARIALTASESDPTKIVEALKLVEDALRRLPTDANAAQLKTEVNAKRESLFNKAFSEGTNDLAARKFQESVTQLKIALTLKPDDADAQRSSNDAQAKLAKISQDGQNEAAYQLAMKNGRDASASGDNATALAEAGKALSLKPGDSEAKQLRDDAQAKLAKINQDSQNEAAYQLAMKNGRDASASGDNATALAEAGKALSLKPGDAGAKQLRDDAQAKLAKINQDSQNEAAYQLAMKNGRDASASGDNATALAEAGKALSLKPGDAGAKQLRDDAQAKLAKINQDSQNEAAYQLAMKNGRDASASGDNATALAEAGKALLLKPGDAGAKQLRDDVQAKLAKINQDSQNEAAYQLAMKNGRDASASGDNETALAEAGKALLLKPGDAGAKRLRDDARTQLAAIHQKEADYQSAMKSGRQLLTLGDTDATKLQPALAQFQVALNSKPSDTVASDSIKEVQRRINRAFSLAFEAGSKEASAGNKDEANRALERMKALKPGDSQVGDLAVLIANIAAPRPSLKRPQSTNFASIIGQSIPDFDFVWVDGIGSGGGAYVAVNELSWGQYQALGGSEKPLNPTFSAHRPVNLEFNKAKALIDSLNGNPAYKKLEFRLPSLDEYKTLSGVADFTAIDGLVTADTSAGESFKRPSDFLPRDIVAGVTTNKVGLRNVIGNVREWTGTGVPFGNSYAWGTTGNYSVTHEPRPGEQIGLRLICEPKN